MSQNMSSAAVMIGTLMANMNTCRKQIKQNILQEYNLGHVWENFWDANIYTRDGTGKEAIPGNQQWRWRTRVDGVYLDTTSTICWFLSQGITRNSSADVVCCNLSLAHVQSQHDTTKDDVNLGDNCIQIFHLGRYIVGYTVGNLVLRQRASGAVKRDFRTYIQRYTSPNEKFEYGYHHSYALLQFRRKSERCKQNNAARHQMKCDVINDDKLFPTVYHRIYCHKFLTLSNQK